MSSDCTGELEPFPKRPEESGRGRLESLRHMKEVRPEDVAAYYDIWTEKYMEAFGDCIQAHRPASEVDLLDYLLRRAGLRDGHRALDAGCGICGPARHFARRLNIEIEAVTISPVQASDCEA